MTDVIDQPQMAIQRAGTNQIASMLQTFLDKGVTADNVSALDKLADLLLKVEAENARKDFAVAKCGLQAEMPNVIARRVIPDKNGNVRSTFAAYEDIWDMVGPLVLKHGFSVSFDMETDSTNGKDRIIAECKLTHVGGHTEKNKCAVRISSPPGASDAQADGATRSYARRGALCDCLNIVIDKDNDARMEGEFISEAMSIALENRAKAIKADIPAFLRVAGVDNFCDIRVGKLGVLQNMLAERERKRSSSPPPAESPATKVQDESHAPAAGDDPSDAWPDAKMPQEQFIDLVASKTGLSMEEADKAIRLHSLGPWFKQRRGEQTSWWDRFIAGKIDGLTPTPLAASK